MDYIAKHFIRLSGRIYTPGEVVDADAFGSESRIHRMLRIGAIVADESFAISEEDDHDESLHDACEPALEAESAEERDDASRIEIDAMDGVVSASKHKSAGRKRK